MNLFTPAEVASMRATQEAAMQDRCLILRWSGSADSLGERVDEWTADESPTICGLGWARRHEAPDADKTVVRGECLLRLPRDTSLDPRDRVQITERFGVAESDPITYDLDGTPAAGPSGLVVRLKRVTL